MRTRQGLPLLLAALLTVLAPTMAWAALENRTTITYPYASGQTMLGSNLVIPATSDSQFSGSNLLIAKDTFADQGYAYINRPMDLVNNDFAITYTITPSAHDSFSYQNDYGSTFFLSGSANTYTLDKNNDYGQLGIYNTSSAGSSNALANALVVEFDGYRGDAVQDPGITGAQDASHVAITHPPASGPVAHQAVSYLPTYYANNTVNTARITWQLVSSTDPNSVTDNVYRYSYSYYQGSGTAAGTPTVTGYVDYTYAQAVAMLGDPTRVYAGFSGSTAGAINDRQTLAFPASYPYTVNYRVQRADGTTTTVAVKGLTSRTGYLPAGPGDVGPLPAAPTGYELVAGQSTAVTISSTGTNTFTYYYRDLAPTIQGATNTTIERGTTFDPRAGVTATDGVDGTLTPAITVSGAVNVGQVGTYTLTYRVTDSAGNTTTATRTVTVVDTTAPTAPTVSPVADGATVLTGTAEPGSTVRVTLPSGVVMSVTAGSDGTWRLPLPQPVTGGQTISVSATDASGNTSPATTVVVPDQTPPPAPKVSPVTETATTVSGTAEPGSTVRVTLPGGTVVSATAAADGSWTVTSSAPLMGNAEVSVTATDAAGNTSPATTVTVPLQTLDVAASVAWVQPTGFTSPTVTLDLLRDGVVVDSRELPAGTTSTTFADLPRYDPATAKPYAWTVTERPVTGYTTSTSGDAATGFTFTNTLVTSDVTLTARNADGAPLPGVVLVLRDANGTQVGTATTGPDGTATFPDAPWGANTVEVTRVPDGYRLPSAPLAVPVDGPEATTQDLVLRPSLQQTLPNTGSLAGWGWRAAGLALLAAGLLLRRPADGRRP